MPDIVITYVRADEEWADQLGLELQRRGITTDKKALRLGDSLYFSIQDGLTSARYAVLVLSRNFFARPWPRGDLDRLARIDRGYQGETKLLPVWHGINQLDISFYSASLAEKVGVPSSSGLATVVAEIADVVQPGGPSVSIDLPLPRAEGERIGSTSTDLVRLRSQLDDLFSWDELNDLCFRLGVSFEDLSGGSKSARTRELVMYLQRRGLLDQLIMEARRLRPHVSW